MFKKCKFKEIRKGLIYKLIKSSVGYLIIMDILALIIVILAVGSALSFAFANTLHEEAGFIESFLTPEYIRTFRENGCHTQQYRDISDMLASLNNNTIKRVLVILKSGDKYYCMANSYFNYSEYENFEAFSDEDGILGYFYVEPDDAAEEEAMEQIFRRERDENTFWSISEGYTCDYYMSVSYKNNLDPALVYIETDILPVVNNVLTVIFVTVITLLIFSAVYAFFVLVRISRLVVVPLKKLSKAAGSATAKMDEQDFTTFQTMKYKNKYTELDVLHDSFVTYEQKLSEYITSLQDVTSKQERMNAELELANNIQSSALPVDFPVCEEFDLYATMTAAKEVGGDFYDFYYLDENHLVITIADVSDKGVPAALFMMKSKSMLANFISRCETLEDAVKQTNNLLCQKNDRMLFVTAFCGVLDLRTGHMEIVNCGHDAPLLAAGSKEFEFLKLESNIVLAVMEDMTYTHNEIDLKPGDTLFLYTDGLTDADDAEHNMFGGERVKNTLNELNKNEINSKDMTEALLEEVKTFVNGNSRFDDITTLVLKFNKFK